VEILNVLKEPVTSHLIVAAFLGSLLGLERELARKDPSLRTFMLISLGSCTFAILSIHCGTNMGLLNNDPGRIAANIVVGIGFLGAGSIFRSRDRIMGLTTAALMWLTAGIGMSVGFDRFDVAFKATVVALSFMILLNLIHQVIHMVYRGKEDA
jgi:putative Mg2+ transporter-C (MgtC) family protein